MSVVAVAVLALATVAYAQTQQNTYKVQGSVSPKHKPGSKKKPVTVGVSFSYQVGEANGLQPSAIDQYKISLYGVRAVNGDKFAKCTPDQITSSGKPDGTTTCPSGSLVGTGTIENFVYTDNDPSGKNGGFACPKKLNIYNSGKNKGALFVYGDPSQCGGVGALPAFPISYVKGAGGGTALEFTVPKTVLHPIAGLSVAVRSVSSTIKKISLKKSGKTYGYYESVSCKGKTRPITVSFHTEAGQTTNTSATPTPKC